MYLSASLQGSISDIVDRDKAAFASQRSLMIRSSQPVQTSSQSLSNKEYRRCHCQRRHQRRRHTLARRWVRTVMASAKQRDQPLLTLHHCRRRTKQRPHRARPQNPQNGLARRNLHSKNRNPLSQPQPGRQRQMSHDDREHPRLSGATTFAGIRFFKVGSARSDALFAAHDAGHVYACYHSRSAVYMDKDHDEGVPGDGGGTWA